MNFVHLATCVHGKNWNCRGRNGWTQCITMDLHAKQAQEMGISIYGRINLSTEYNWNRTVAPKDIDLMHKKRPIKCRILVAMGCIYQRIERTTFLYAAWHDRPWGLVAIRANHISFEKWRWMRCVEKIYGGSGVPVGRKRQSGMLDANCVLITLSFEFYHTEMERIGRRWSGGCMLHPRPQPLPRGTPTGNYEIIKRQIIGRLLAALPRGIKYTSWNKEDLTTVMRLRKCRSLLVLADATFIIKSPSVYKLTSG